VPPLTSQFIEVVKNSAVVMLIGLEELTFQTQHIEHETFRGFEAATAVTLLYLLLALAVSGGMALLARRARAA
jgi:polar amino acid transport system permease protein